MEERPRTQETRKLPWLWLAGAALVVNCACLAACRLAGLYGPLFFANLLLHPLIGLALCLPFAHWWRRQQRPPSTLLTAAGLLLGASAIAGVALAPLGNPPPIRPPFRAHLPSP